MSPSLSEGFHPGQREHFHSTALLKAQKMWQSMHGAGEGAFIYFGKVRGLVNLRLT